MARYGLAIYGQDVYGDLSALRFDVSPFTAKAARTERGVMDVRWTVPSGTWSNFRLLRNSSGTPVNEQDGTVLIEDASPPSNFVDRDLAEGQFYYYAIFLFTANTWLRVGATTGLALGPHDYSEMMYRFLPDFWREADSSANAVTRVTRSPGGGVSTALVAGSANRTQPMRRFLELVGYEFNLLRTEYDSLRFLRNTDRISGGLLSVLNQMLSVGDESALGVAQQRVIARNAINIRKRKGTYPGLEAAVSAFTSWGADVTDGKNIALTRGYEHAGATNGTSSTDRTGEPFLLATGDGGGDMSVDLTPPGYYIPVQGATTYSVQVKGRSDATARNVRLDGRWLGADGAQLATFTTTAASANAGGNVTSGTDTSHADAVWLGLTAVVTGPSNTEAYELSELQVEQAGSPTAWEAPRSVLVTLQPTRVNLIPNPTFEVDTVTWAPSASATIARTTDAAKVGVASMRVTPNGVNDNVHGYIVLPVVSGETYTFSYYVLAEHAQTESYAASLYTRTAAQAALGTYGTYVSVASADGWVRVSTTFTAEATAADAVLRLRQQAAAPTGADTYLVDAVMLEKTPIVRGYFDGGSTTDAIWQGAAHNSASSYYPSRGPKTARLGTLLPELLPPEREFALQFS